ncbi:MAG TPA: OsmC family protein [Steroidobacteraceae bacterium]|jgi:organic hydroperoxide reductase OsmC/OhrA|nr:OsmC family protein [Steroidobacteraceae bacterium]
MQLYTAETTWQRGEQPFLDNRYSRRHVVRFDGGVEIPGSSSTHVVKAPMSDPAAVNPEELFVASLSTCHMLWFLSIAAQRHFRVDRYVDKASGTMEEAPNGKFAMTVVTLRPTVSFSGDSIPTEEDQNDMHHHAHDECFIANSVRCDVRCEPAPARTPGMT